MSRSWTVALAIAAGAVLVAPAASTPAQTPDRGGAIAVAVPLEPACLNVLVATCTESAPIVGFAVEKALLPAFDVDARFRYRPRLVSAVTVSTRAPVTLTYHIRPQARWNDGVPVTAADFVFTHAARLAQAATLNEGERADLRHVRRVTAVGAKTVRVTLREPFSGWQRLFGNVLPRHVLQGEDLSAIWLDRVDDPKTGKPIGSGPFLVEGHERGKALTLIRNPQYWGPHQAYVDRLVFRFDSGDPVDSLLKGGLDMAVILPAPMAAPFLNDQRFRVFSPPAAGYDHLAIRLGHGGHPALRNPLVRRALAYGIDRAVVSRAVAGPKQPLQSLVYLVQSPYQRSNWQRYKRRPALARALLVPGRVQAGGRRDLLVRRQAAVAPVRYLRGDSTEAGHPHHDPGTAAGGRGRGRADLRLAGGVHRHRSPAWTVRGRAVRLELRSGPRRREGLLLVRRRRQLHGILLAVGQPCACPSLTDARSGRAGARPECRGSHDRGGCSRHPTLAAESFRRRQGEREGLRQAPVQPVRRRGELVGRPLAVVAAVAVSLLAVSGAGGAATQQAPKRGGTLVITTPTQGEPACLNPFVDDCAFLGPLDRGLSEVLAGAFDVEPDATFRPQLIIRADIVSRKPFTLVYHIRPEARWSDGVPVTASDFVFTHRMILEHRPGVEFEYPSYVKLIRPLDAKTFRLVMRSPYPDWRFFFTVVLPRHALAGRDLETVWKDAIDNPRTGAPIGSGPFLVGSWERGKQLVLVRNPRYWGEHAAYLNRIALRFLPVEDAAESLRRGEADMINPSSRVMQAESLELRRQPAPGISVRTVALDSIEHFDIRIGEGGHPALRNRLVRQALAYGIDRDEIARSAGRLDLGSGVAVEPQDSVVFLSNNPYYRPSWRGYRYRPDRARQLLEQAGCRRGQDPIYSCGGDRLRLRFTTIAGVKTRERTLELVQGQLRQAGVEVVPVYAPFGSFFDLVYGGEFDLALYSWGVGASTAGPGDTFECQKPDNTTGYCDRLVTRDLDQATRIVDRGRRIRLLNRVDPRLARAVPVIPLYQEGRVFAQRGTLRGLIPNGTGRFTWNAEDWWLAEQR